MDDILLKCQDFINRNKIEQVAISKSINDSNNLKNLKNVDLCYCNKKINTLFIGIYNTIDLNLVKKHVGKKWVLWYGNDCDYKSSLRRSILFEVNFDFIENISLDKSHENLEQLKINHFNLNDGNYYSYELNYEIKKTNIFDDIKKIYILNLKRRKDRRQLMNFKLSNISINNYEYFDAVDCLDDSEVIDMFNNFNNSITSEDYICDILCMQKPSNFAILKSYKELYYKIINSDYLDEDYVIIFEDDICFLNDIDEKVLSLDKDIIYLGSNELNNKVLETINNKNITYGAYGICYKVKVMKKFYEIYFKNFSNLRKPYDYLLWEFINNENISNKIIYPNLVVPNLNDSDNMKSRDIHRLSKLKNWTLTDYALIDLEIIFYNMYKNVINNNINLRFFKDKNILDVSYYQISKIIEEDNKSFVFIINKNFDSKFELFLKLLKKQSYPFWRAYYSNKKFGSLIKKYNLSKKIRYIDEKFLYKDDFLINANVNIFSLLKDSFLEDLNKEKLIDKYFN